MKQRFEYLDSIKGFCIILVVLGHVYPSYNIIKIWLYSFHMPVFFIISGTLINYTNIIERPTFKIVFSKFQGLIIPYFSFELLFIFYRMCLDGFTFRNCVNGVISSITMYCNAGATWYLPCLFFSEILFIFLLKCISNKKITALISFMLFIVPFAAKNYNLNHNHIVILRCFTALGFIAFGYFACKYILEVTVSWRTLLLLFTAEFVLSFVNKCVDLWGLSFGNSYLYIINAIAGSIFIINFFKQVPAQRLLTFLGQNTIIILGTQKLILEIISKFTNQTEYGYFSGAIICIVTLLIEIPIIFLIKTHFPFMLGKSTTKR